MSCYHHFRALQLHDVGRSKIYLLIEMEWDRNLRKAQFSFEYLVIYNFRNLKKSCLYLWRIQVRSFSQISPRISQRAFVLQCIGGKWGGLSHFNVDFVVTYIICNIFAWRRRVTPTTSFCLNPNNWQFFPFYLDVDLRFPSLLKILIWAIKKLNIIKFVLKPS